MFPSSVESVVDTPTQQVWHYNSYTTVADCYSVWVLSLDALCNTPHNRVNSKSMYYSYCSDIGLLKVLADSQGWNIAIALEVNIQFWDTPNVNVMFVLNKPTTTSKPLASLFTSHKEQWPITNYILSLAAAYFSSEDTNWLVDSPTGWTQQWSELSKTN